MKHLLVRIALIILVVLSMLGTFFATVEATFEECEPDPTTQEVNQEACQKRFRDEHPHSGAPAVGAPNAEWQEFLDDWREDHRLSDETYCALRDRNILGAFCKYFEL